MKNSQHPTIRAEIATLQQQIKHLDLPGRINREDRAAAQVDSLKAANRQIQALGAAERQLLALGAEHQQAREHHIGAEREIASVNREICHLTRMLNAYARVAGAHTAIAALAPLADAAQNAVGIAQSIHAEIESLVATEALALDRAKSDAAGAVLSQIKAGKSGTLPSVSRDRLDALTLALEAAAAKLLDAQEASAEGASKLADAKHAHAICTVPVTCSITSLSDSSSSAPSPYATTDQRPISWALSIWLSLDSSMTRLKFDDIKQCNFPF
ncbi:hypothetical protein [Polaromonas sp.]|uniref:hypothetical protein n=1 Tax=Polaromonas sp. TaxID=1869339 RepID=UPI0018025E3F|nr:hypothetical protein [Polaromonas sp.]NML87280.1 hypothetical protein [Polaromonas sp.]